MEKSTIETIFRCPSCRIEYKNKEDAIKCINSDEKANFKVGDIIELKYGFDWFDGDRRWVINPDVDMSKHGFGPDCSMGFYYVITYIDREKHRIRYHVYTNAMTGDQGYKSGYTFNTQHYTPKLIKCSDFIKKDSEKLIGLKAKYLL